MLYSVQLLSEKKKSVQQDINVFVIPVVLNKWPVSHNLPCFSEGKEILLLHS